MEVDYLIYLQTQANDVAVIPVVFGNNVYFDDNAYKKGLGRELLLLLGPYAPAKGSGKWVGSTVTVQHPVGNKPLTMEVMENSMLIKPRYCLTKEAQKTVNAFSEYRTICNFTRGEYLFFRDGYSKWIIQNPSVGTYLLELLTTTCQHSWSGCEIAVTNTVPPWMKRVATANPNNTPMPHGQRCFVPPTASP